MKKVVFFIINYKSDDFLFRFLDSVYQAKQEVDISLDIVVLDNSEKSEKENQNIKTKLENEKLSVTFQSNDKNLGYFGPIPIAQEYLRTRDSDYVIYCNPDLRLDKQFLKELLNSSVNGVIAPAIISESKNIDQNPKYLSKLSLEKMQRLKLIYGNSILYTLFFLMADFKEFLEKFLKKGKTITKQPIKNIYAPHGAMFIFKNIDFFKSLKEFPCFLFGEEIFIAEEALKNNVSIDYMPQLRVFDIRHASISLLSTKFKRELYYSSINYLFKEYYK